MQPQHQGFSEVRAETGPSLQVQDTSVRYEKAVFHRLHDRADYAAAQTKGSQLCKQALQCRPSKR